MEIVKIVPSNWDEQETLWVVVTKIGDHAQAYGPFAGTKQTTEAWAALEIDADSYEIIEIIKPFT